MLKNKKKSERFRVFLECPRCKKNSETLADGGDMPRGVHLSCGDCLMDDIEIVEMKIVAWHREDEKKPPQPEGQ